MRRVNRPKRWVECKEVLRGWGKGGMLACTKTGPTYLGEMGSQKPWNLKRQRKGFVGTRLDGQKQKRDWESGGHKTKNVMRQSQKQKRARTGPQKLSNSRTCLVKVRCKEQTLTKPKLYRRNLQTKDALRQLNCQLTIQHASSETCTSPNEATPSLVAFPNKIQKLTHFAGNYVDDWTFRVVLQYLKARASKVCNIKRHREETLIF